MKEMETSKNVKKLTAISRIHQSIGANLELEKFAQIVVVELVEIVKCNACAILAIEGGKVKILAESGFIKEFGEKEFSIDMPAIKYILDSGQSIYTGDITNSPAANCVPAGCAISSLICTPIIVNKDVKGIIHLDSFQEDAFNEEILHFVEMLSQEISIVFERSFLYQQVKNLSLRDGLTGCFNRRRFDEDIEFEVCRAGRYKRVLSILMIDIDWFKKYNDFHGHPKGDVVLKKMVALFTRNIRIVDKIYRYGGEEFVILLPEIDKEKALVVANRLQKMTEQEEFAGASESQPNKKITISIGVASYPSDAVTKGDLIKAADIALYKAKQTGRNKICCK